MWKIPKIWSDQTCFILGGGPSLTTGPDLSIVLKDKNVLGVNAAFYLGDFVDVCFFGDAKFYWWNKEAIQAFPNLRVSLNNRVPERDPDISGEPDIHIIKKVQLRGLSSACDGIAWNRSSGGAAIDLAVHFGAVRLVLLGYDMRQVEGEKNWRPHAQEKTNQNPFEFMMGHMDDLAKVANERGITIFNATLGSALQCFPKITLKQGLKL